MSQRALSNRAGWHESKTSRIENASAEPSESDVITCNLLEAVSVQESLTLRLRTDTAKPLTDTAAVEGLTTLLTAWREQYGPASDSLPDLGEGGDGDDEGLLP